MKTTRDLPDAKAKLLAMRDLCHRLDDPAEAWGGELRSMRERPGIEGVGKKGGRPVPDHSMVQARVLASYEAAGDAWIEAWRLDVVALRASSPFPNDKRFTPPRRIIESRKDVCGSRKDACDERENTPLPDATALAHAGYVVAPRKDAKIAAAAQIAGWACGYIVTPKSARNAVANGSVALVAGRQGAFIKRWESGVLTWARSFNAASAIYGDSKALAAVGECPGLSPMFIGKALGAELLDLPLDGVEVEVEPMTVDDRLPREAQDVLARLDSASQSLHGVSQRLGALSTAVAILNGDAHNPHGRVLSAEECAIIDEGRAEMAAAGIK